MPCAAPGVPPRRPERAAARQALDRLLPAAVWRDHMAIDEWGLPPGADVERFARGIFSHPRWADLDRGTLNGRGNCRCIGDVCGDRCVVLGRAWDSGR